MSNRANIFLAMKKLEEAEKVTETAIGLDPKNAKESVLLQKTNK